MIIKQIIAIVNAKVYNIIMHKIIGAMRRAIKNYKMIPDGDKIAVGVSGGKDSLALLTALAYYRKFSPEKFDLVAITIDLGFEGADEPLQKLKEYCDKLGVEFVVEKTDIAKIIFEERKETNPCSLCSKMRRGALHTVAGKLGANKVALGHHVDDVLDTFLLSFIYEGRLSTFKPVTYLSRADMTVIRPLIYVQEGDIKGATVRHSFPVYKNPCPADHKTERESMKELVQSICKDIPIARDRMTSAVIHPERYNLFPPIVED